MRKQPRYGKGDRIANRFLVHQALMGGMGEVYLCLDEKEVLPFALKTFQGSSPELGDIFKREVATWIALEKHPNIVRCFWMEKFDNIPFMLLEWVAGDESRGTDLRSWLRRGPLDLPLALRFTIDIVRGLIHANEKVLGIVHRDLKPDNVLVNQSRQAKITDFGLAKVIEEAKLSFPVTEEGQTIPRYSNMGGTHWYMAPEQWQGFDLDFRTDVYAVGCILYELLTGEMLYQGRTIGKLRIQHLEAPLPALENDLPSELKPILDSCLAKKREERYARLELLLADLNRVYEAYSDHPLPEVGAEPFTAFDYNNRGVTFDRLGQHKRAIEDYEAAIHLNPAEAQLFSNRGNSYWELQQYKRAIADCDTAVRLDPTLAGAYSNRGNGYARLGQHERAIVDHDKAISLDPADGLSHYNRGLSHAALGHFQQAITDYDEAIRLGFMEAQVYYARGNIHAKLGGQKQAIDDFGAATRINPTNSEAYYNQGVCYAELNQLDEALVCFDVAIQLDPDDPQAYFNKAAALFNLGSFKESLSCFETAYSLGFHEAAPLIQRTRRELGLPPIETTTNPSEPQEAFEAFQLADSLNAIRQVVAQYPVLLQMIPMIEQAIAQQAPLQLRPQYEQKLLWLKQVAGRDSKPGLLGRLFGKKGE